MPQKPRVLFLCTGNSCRSQMAEGWLRHLAGDAFEALSAGSAPVAVNPRAVASMARAGVDISAQTSKDVRTFFEDPPHVLVAVCDRALESCPCFPGPPELLLWPTDDPAHARGTDARIDACFDRVRDELRERIEAWLPTMARR